MAVLFAWNQRPKDKISYESLRLATELPDAELRRTLWVSRKEIFIGTLSELVVVTVRVMMNCYWKGASCG